MSIFENHTNKVLILLIAIPIILILYDYICGTNISKYWAPIGTSFIVAVALFAYFLNKKLKQIDVQMKCQERFERLKFEVLPSVRNIIGQENAYYQRFWTLQFEQFQYYMNGFISEQIYWSWLRSIEIDAEKNESIGMELYIDAWERVRQDFIVSNQKFVSLIDSVHKGELPSSAQELNKHIKNTEFINIFEMPTNKDRS